MKKLTFILIVLSSLAYGQNFEVLSVDKASTKDGERIVDGQLLSIRDTVTVKKGELRLRLKNRWVFIKEKGTWALSSVYSNYKLEHSKHDSICSILKTRNLLGCELDYDEKEKIASNCIEFEKLVIDTTSTRIPIKWDDPGQNHNIEYYVILMDFGEEFLGLYKTNKSNFQLDLASYESRNNIFLVRIKSVECHESENLAIVIRK